MDIDKVNLKLLISISSFVLIISLLFSYINVRTPYQKPADVVLPPQETVTTQSNSNEIKSKGLEIENAPGANDISVSNSEPEIPIQDPVDKSSNFSDQVPLLGEQRRDNVETFITRADLPVELQHELDRTMEFYRQNGYLEVDESLVEYMDAPYNEVVEFDMNDPSLLFVTDNLENTALADMEYVGVIPDRDLAAPGAPVPEIRRVFKHEAGYLYLSEAGMNSSGALLQQEFVNKSVKGYPATQMTYCSPSERCVTTLTWLTADKRYELSLRGDIEALGEEKLESIANSLNLPPVPSQK